MPLDFQNVSIDLTNGVAQKQNAKNVVPTKLRSLENAFFDADGSLNRRKGAERVCDGTIVGGARSVTAADFAASFGNEMLQATGDELYSYSASQSQLAYRGRAPHVSLRKQPIIRNTSTQTNCDWARSADFGISLYAWEDSRGGVRYSVFDNDTDAALVWDTQVSATGQMPRCFVTTKYLAIVYIDGGNLKYSFVDLSVNAPSASLTSSTLKTDVGARKAMDAQVVASDRLMVAYCPTNKIQRFAFDINSTVGASISSVTVGVLSAVAVTSTTDGKIQTAYTESAVGLRVVVDTISGTTLTNSTVATTLDAATGGAAQLTAVESGTPNNIVIYATTVTVAPNAVIRAASCTSAASGIGNGEFLLHCQLAGAAFKHGTKVYVPVVFDSAVQGAVFLLESATRSVVARALPLSGAVTTANYVRLGAAVAHGAVVGLPVLEKGRLEIKDALAISTLGVSRLDFTMDRTEPMPPLRFADSLILPAACPMAYDGVSAVELGFNVYPETVTAASGGAGNVPSGSRFFAAAYEWTDAKGRRHQSAPSLSSAYTNAGATKVNVVVQTLSLTDKYDNSGVVLKPVARTNVRIVVFATEVDGTVFYRCGATDNNPLGATVTYTHDVTDGALIAGEILYDATNAGTFDNYAPPACRVACVHQNQLVIAGCEDDRALYYSRPLVDGAGPSFDYARRLRVPEDAGEVSAAATMDTKLVAWTDEGAGWFSGDAPNAAGQGGGYSDWQPLSSDVGCTEPRSIVYVEGALWFQSAGKLHALTGDGSVVYAGADVETSNVDAITGVVLVPSKKQVRWTQSTGAVLVYDYFWKQWSTIPVANSPWAAVAADLWDGSMAWVTSDGVLFRESETSALDELATGQFGLYVLKFTTAWLKLGGTQGYQRVRRALVVGNADATATFSIYSGLDYVAPSIVEIEQVDYPAASPFQIRHHLSAQKCEAISFRIEIATEGAFSLQNLTLEVGLKRGGFKMAQT